MARFTRGQADAGDSNATIAKQLGMNLTTVAAAPARDPERSVGAGH